MKISCLKERLEDYSTGGINAESQNLPGGRAETILSVPLYKSAQAVDRERETFLKTLYSRHGKALLRYVRGLVQGDQDAEDHVQSVFARFSALEKPQTLENPEAYLYRAARNEVIDHSRRRQRESAILVDNPQGLDSEGFEVEYSLSPERVELAREGVDKLQKLLAKMPAKRRQVFILVRVEGMTYPEAARQLGISREAVQKHMIRALAACRHSLAGFRVGDTETEDAANG